MSTRRNWIKLYVGQTLRGTMMDELTPAERWVFIGLLLLAGDSAFDGQVSLTQRIGYSDEQIANLIKVPIALFLRAKEKLADPEINKIIVLNRNVIKIVNWHKYQSEYGRQKQYRKPYASSELQSNVTGKSYAEKEIEKEIEIEKENKEKEKNIIRDPKIIEKKFNLLKENWPAGRISKINHCKTKFTALCKRGDLPRFKIACQNYADELDYQKNIKNFNQTPMLLDTFLNNWEGWEKRKTSGARSYD